MTTVDIEVIRAIVKEHQFREIDGVVIDVQTANAIVTVYDALDAENRAKLDTLSVDSAGRIAWEVLSR